MREYIEMTINDLIDLLRAADPEGNRQIVIDGCFYDAELCHGDLELTISDNEYTEHGYLIIR